MRTGLRLACKKCMLFKNNIFDRFLCLSSILCIAFLHLCTHQEHGGVNKGPFQRQTFWMILLCSFTESKHTWAWLYAENIFQPLCWFSSCHTYFRPKSCTVAAKSFKSLITWLLEWCTTSREYMQEVCLTRCSLWILEALHEQFLLSFLKTKQKGCCTITNREDFEHTLLRGNSWKIKQTLWNGALSTNVSRFSSQEYNRKGYSSCRDEFS